MSTMRGGEAGPAVMDVSGACAHGLRNTYKLSVNSKKTAQKNANGPQTKADQPFIDNSNPQKNRIERLVPKSESLSASIFGKCGT